MNCGFEIGPGNHIETGKLICHADYFLQTGQTGHFRFRYLYQVFISGVKTAI